MKIAHIYIVDLSLRTASGNQALSMANEFSAYGDVTYISSWVSKENFMKTLEWFGLPQHFRLKLMPVKWLKYSKFERVTRLLYCLFAYLHVKLNKYDVIYTPDYSFIYLVSFLPKFLRPKAPIVYEPHKIYSRALNYVSTAQEQKSLDVCSLFIPTTIGSKEELMEVFGKAEKKMFQFANCVDLNNFNSVNPPENYLVEKYPSLKGKTVLIYSGSFLEWKGVDIFIKSMKHIKAENFKALLIGGEGDYKINMEKLAKEEGVWDKLIIDGFKPQKEVIAALKSSDIGVIPNINDPEGDKYTSPLKAYEYMACGLPIVVADLFSMRQILREDVNAVYFQPGNEKDLAQKIDLLLDDAKLRKRLRENNLKEAPNHTWAKRAEKVMGFIKSRLSEFN